MGKALDNYEKESYLLVTFYHGTNATTIERYTDWQQSVSSAVSTPKMAVRIPENTGTFEEKEMRILLPDDPFVTRLANGLQHSPVFVKIVEVTQTLVTGGQNTELVLYRGRLQRSIGNYQGRSKTVGLFFLPAKSKLQIALGIPCNHHCPWTLFGRGCQLVKSSFDVVGEIDSVDGKIITVTTANVINKLDRYWRRGYATKGGLSVPIREWIDTDPTKVGMARRVPNDWIGGSGDIVFTPGCDKTIAVCRTVYNNEEHFAGIGIAIPSYNPNFESRK